MQLNLDEISCCVVRVYHAIVLLDQPLWHMTAKLRLPRNVSLIFLPSRAPELNPVENVWQLLPANWLSNTVFDDVNHITNVACYAWNKHLRTTENHSIYRPQKMGLSRSKVIAVGITNMSLNSARQSQNNTSMEQASGT